MADALEQDARHVGERCDELVRQQHWIAHVALGGLPDGSIAARYAFRHALYRHVFYQRIGTLIRAGLHRNVVLSMERRRAAGLAVTAAELASHYDLGQDPMAALHRGVGLGAPGTQSGDLPRSRQLWGTAMTGGSASRCSGSEVKACPSSPWEGQHRG